MCALALLLFYSQSAKAGFVKTSASSPPSLRGLLTAFEDASSGDHSSSSTSARQSQPIPEYKYEVDLEAKLAPLNGQTSKASCSISGFVFVDADNDGQKGLYDVVFVGAEIKAFNQADPDHHYTATTDSDGMFHFGGLPTGYYTLWQPVQPQDFVDGRETVGGVFPGSSKPIFGTECGQVDDKTNHPSRIVNIGLTGNSYYGFNYNFGERGLVASAVSKRLLLSGDDEPLDPVPEPSSLLLVCGATCVFLAASGRRRVGRYPAK